MLITDYVLPAAAQDECRRIAGFRANPLGHWNFSIPTVVLTDIDKVLQAFTAPLLIHKNQFNAGVVKDSVVQVPLIWLRTQPKIVSDIYETELAWYRRHCRGLDMAFHGATLKQAVDRLRCVSAALPDHVGLAELRDEAMLLEATSVLLEAAKRR